jgi:hypothetical protein
MSAISSAKYIVEHEVDITYSEFIRILRNVVTEAEAQSEAIEAAKEALKRVRPQAKGILVIQDIDAALAKLEALR